MSSTILLDISTPDDQAMSVQARELMNVTRPDVGDYPIMDMTIPATERTSAILINSMGAIYRCSAPSGSKTLCVFKSFLLVGGTFVRLRSWSSRELLHSFKTSDDTSADDEVWKLAAWDCEDSCLVASRRSAHCLDFRVSMLLSQLSIRVLIIHCRSRTARWICMALTMGAHSLASKSIGMIV